MHEVNSRNILMISIGATFTKEATNDNIQRHLDYSSSAKMNIHQVAFAPEVNQEESISFENRYFIYPSGAKNMLSFPTATIKTVTQLSQKIKFDLIYTQDPFGTAATGLSISNKLSIPIIIGNHSSFIDNKHWISERPLLFTFFNFLAKRNLPKADACRVINNREKNIYHNTLKIPLQKIQVINTPVNLDKFLFKDEESSLLEVKQKLGWGKSMKVIIWVGRPVKVKRIPLLLEVFANVVSQYQNARLLIIGKKSQLQEEVDTYIETLQIKDKVTWLANGVPHDKLSMYYQLADLYLHTSIYEGFGKTIAEASACSLPIVTTDTAGAKMIVKHEQTGIVVPLEDKEALTQAVLRLLEDETLASTMGAAGSKHVKEKYDYKKGVEKITDLWQKVLN